MLRLNLLFGGQQCESPADQAKKASSKCFSTDVELPPIQRARKKGCSNRSCQRNAIQPILKLAHFTFPHASLIGTLLVGCLSTSSYLKGAA